MRPDDFDLMTPAEFMYAYIAWSDLEQGHLKQAWERERWAVWIQTSIQLDRKDRQDMVQMFPLPWEVCVGAEPRKPLTMQERKERVNQILNRT